MLRPVAIFILFSSLAFGAAAQKSAAPSDGVIESTIRAKFAKSKINEEHFKVTVRSGVALLEGKTAVPQHKGAATRLARSGGAREVVNKIEVSEAARKQMTERLQRGRDRKLTAGRTSPARPSPTVTAAPPQPPQAISPSTVQPLRRMEIKR